VFFYQKRTPPLFTEKVRKMNGGMVGKRNSEKVGRNTLASR
jgi:hypothetical protein